MSAQNERLWNIESAKWPIPPALQQYIYIRVRAPPPKAVAQAPNSVTSPTLLHLERHGTNRMSPSRCRFLLESVKDLQARLRSKGSDLLVKRGHPEAVIPDLAKELVGGEGSTPSMPAKLTLYAHTDVCSEEADVHSAVKKALSQVQGGGSGGGSGKRGVTVKEVWGNTLHRLSDLPFDLPHGVPEIFTQVKAVVYE